MNKSLQDFDWDEIHEALETLQSDTEENEPEAVNYIAAIQNVLDGLPENE